MTSVVALEAPFGAGRAGAEADAAAAAVAAAAGAPAERFGAGWAASFAFAAGFRFAAVFAVGAGFGLAAAALSTALAAGAFAGALAGLDAGFAAAFVGAPARATVRFGVGRFRAGFDAAARFGADPAGLLEPVDVSWAIAFSSRAPSDPLSTSLDPIVSDRLLTPR